jgi:hypothetical protein
MKNTKKEAERNDTAHDASLLTAQIDRTAAETARRGNSEVIQNAAQSGKAEAELLELIRLHDAKHFTLSITCADGRWTIAVEALDGQAGVAIGNGDSFSGAWFSIKPGGRR